MRQFYGRKFVGVQTADNMTRHLCVRGFT